MLLLPRDYLSTFMKIGTIVLLALGILFVLPPIKMPADDPVHRRLRAGVRGQDLSLLLHHHRVRRHLRIPCAGVVRHHAQDDPPRSRTRGSSATAAMLMESFVAVMALVRRHRARSRHLLRHQRAARLTGRDRRDGRRSDSRLGIHRDSRGDHRARGVGRREDAAGPDRRRHSLAVGMATIFSSVVAARG